MKIAVITGSRADWNGLGMVAKELQALGAKVVHSNPEYQAVRLQLDLTAIEADTTASPDADRDRAGHGRAGRGPARRRTGPSGQADWHAPPGHVPARPRNRQQSKLYCEK